MSALLVTLLAFQYHPRVMVQRYAWLVLILLAAASLRLVGLSQIPPGLTHDEADHGLDAWGVVNGDRPIYFTVGYGREPRRAHHGFQVLIADDRLRAYKIVR